MGVKEDACAELLKLIEEHDLRPSTVGREIQGDPGFVKRLQDPTKNISTKTLDSVWSYIVKVKAQKKETR